MKNAAIWGAASLFVLWAGCGIDANVFTEGDAPVTEDDDGTTTTTSGEGGSSSIVVGSGGTISTTAVSVGQGGTMMTSVVSSSAVTTSTGSGMMMTLDCGGNLTCPSGGVDACCWDNFDGNNGAGKCVSGPPENDGCNTSFNGRQTRIECQRTSDCGTNELCCAHRVQTQQGTFYEELTCETSCNFPDIQVCESLQDSMNCPLLPIGGGQTVQGECQQSELLPPGYVICGYPD